MKFEQYPEPSREAMEDNIQRARAAADTLNKLKYPVSDPGQRHVLSEGERALDNIVDPYEIAEEFHFRQQEHFRLKDLAHTQAIQEDELRSAQNISVSPGEIKIENISTSNKNNEEQSLEIEKKKIQNALKSIFLDDSKRLLTALRERQRDNLIPIQTHSDLTLMIGLMERLANFDKKIDEVSLQEVIDDVRKLKIMFQNFGTLQSGAIKREDKDNLDKLYHGNNIFRDALYRERIKFSPRQIENNKVAEKMKTLHTIIGFLADDTVTLRRFATRLKK